MTPRVTTVLLLILLNIGALGCCKEAPSPPPAAPKSPQTTSVEIEEETYEQLSALGYAERVPNKEPGKKGVTLHDEAKASPGLNLIYPVYFDESDPDSATAPIDIKGKEGQIPSAILIDMKGKVVHRWLTSDQRRDAGDFFARMLPTGDLFAMSSKNRLMSRYTWDGTKVWTTALGCHHDLNFGPDGTIYTLTKTPKSVTHNGVKIPITDNGVAILSPDGVIQREFSLRPAFWKYVPKANLDKLSQLIKLPKEKHPKGEKRKLRDIFHSNSIQYITRDVPGLCPKDSLLISIRNLNRIACIDLDGKELWSWGPDVVLRQHHPTLLDTNTILLFDNGQKPRRYSRILELDPARGMEIVWQYKHRDFFSRTRGAAQKLGNGNVLITESNDGRAFEVTPGGEVVWEFYTTDIDLTKRFALYRLQRYAPDFLKR